MVIRKSHAESSTLVRPDRRRFLELSALVFLGSLLPRYAFALGGEPSAATHSLAFFHTHTCESLSCIYRQQGRLDRQTLTHIDHILRDHHNGEVKVIATKLLDLLCELKTRLGTDQPFHVISGYRSPATNEKLRRQGKSVARRSMHLEGKAVDIRVPGVPLARLRQVALDLQAGGVGYYPRSDFVHVDVGRVRRW